MSIPTGMGHAGIVAIPIPPDGATGEVLTKATPADYDTEWGPGGGGGGAPVDAEYIVAVANPTLTAERVLTNSATVTWDFSVPGQASATAVGGYPAQLGYAGI